jgi:hypothetical protein
VLHCRVGIQNHPLGNSKRWEILGIGNRRSVKEDSPASRRRDGDALASLLSLSLSLLSLSLSVSFLLSFFLSKTPWSESASELYRPSDRRLSAK